jgi:hypothetical protein
MKVVIDREANEKELDRFALEMYQQAEKIIEPIYPWVLVRIMPKELKVGSIILPEKQNRIFYEGIVLRTWAPFWRIYTGDLKFDEEDANLVDSTRVINKRVQMKSSVEVGDRVIFMHFEGQPYPYLDELHYRMIHEVETHPNGGIWGKLHLREDEGLKEKLNKLFKNKSCVSVSGE